MSEWKKSFRKHRWRVALIVVAVVAVAGIARMVYLRAVAELPWADGTGFEIKMLWEWLELLVIPGALAVVAWYLNSQDREAEREETRERVQETVLQCYLDKMTELIIRYDLKGTRGG